MKIITYFCNQKITKDTSSSMKRLLTFCLSLPLTLLLNAQSFETATQAITNMGVGWNLGNTLDANSNNGARQGLESEIYWGQPYTKPELMQMLKTAGFGAIRVPVTWMNHMDANGKVDAEWMARVHEVVDYVLDAGMYCLLNVHHDTGDGSFHWLHASSSTYNSTKAKYEYLWQQIATEFKDYDQRLLFEAYNEMLDKYDSWCFATFNRPGGYNATDASEAYAAINNYAQSFVTTVRNTGGNNAHRNLVVNTYAAANGYGNWNAHLNEVLTKMAMPNDPAGEGHIAFQVHFYPNVKNLNSTKIEVDGMISLLKNRLASKGGPVIVGEWGTANDGESDYMVRRQNVLQYAEYFVKKAKENGIATFQWMGISDGADRAIPVFTQPDLAEAILKAWYGDSFQPVLPTREDLGETIYEVTFTGQWTEVNLVSEALNTSSFSRVELTLAEAPAPNALQYKVYKSPSGDLVQKVSSASSSLVLNAATMGSTIQRITLQNCLPSAKITIKDILLVKSDGTKLRMTPTSFWGCTIAESFVTSIQPPTPITHRPSPDSYYDLQGHRVANPTCGIYICNGKKIIIR